MGKSVQMNSVSVIICVKDCESLLQPCIESVTRNQPSEIIVVDGLSSDQTVVIAKKLGARVVSDGGRGLAYARRVGALEAKENNILYIGPDNILPASFISDMVRMGNKYGFGVVGAQTRVLDPKSFSDRGLDFRWQLLMGKPGPREVIGTPTLYLNGVLLETNYEERAANADDTDVAERMRAKGVRLGVVPVQVFDSNGLTIENTWKKFKWYGSGDAHFYRNHSPGWTVGRKIFSLSHPFRQTIKFSVSAFMKLNFSAAIWLNLMMVARYYGWLSMSRKLNRNGNQG